MDTRQRIVQMAKEAKGAAWILSAACTDTKNQALLVMAANLLKKKQSLIKANQADLRLARKNRKSRAFIDRLTLNEERIAQMSRSLRNIAALADPVGQLIRHWRRPNGLLIRKVRVPIGVVAIIYESRPNVTSDCVGLCLKSSNAVILRGGKDALHSNIAIFDILQNALNRFKIPKTAINLIKIPQHQAVDILLGLPQFIDLVIPRGGEGLIKLVSEKSKIPVIKHYKGICHIYVDNQADLAMARRIAYNAKVQRPGVCNAMETLLVHQDIAKKFLPLVIGDLQRAGVEIRADAPTRRLVKGLLRAKEVDWSTEYLDLILSVKVVPDLNKAIEHINRYGSSHSDAIITNNRTKAKRFLQQVDSACVYVNASTRFTDGYEFGLGAEMGISTDKIHARGPMALEELTTYKYEVIGRGQIRT